MSTAVPITQACETYLDIVSIGSGLGKWGKVAFINSWMDYPALVVAITASLPTSSLALKTALCSWVHQLPSSGSAHTWSKGLLKLTTIYPPSCSPQWSSIQMSCCYPMSYNILLLPTGAVDAPTGIGASSVPQLELAAWWSWQPMVVAQPWKQLTQH